MKRLSLLCVVAFLAGCVSPAALDDAGVPAEISAATLNDDGTLTVEVDVPVVLVGFPESIAEALSARIPEEKAHHVPVRSNVILPPRESGTTVWDWDPFAFAPVARPVFIAAPEEFVAAYRLMLTEAALADDLYDGNAVEAWLAAELPGLGVQLDPKAPALVVLHGDADGAAGHHSFHYVNATDHDEPVRVFGERFPLLAVDVSARGDPWVDSRHAAGRGTLNAYDEPLIRTEGDVVVTVLEELVRDAVHYRLMQGPTYRVPTAPCHAVTLLLGIRGAAGLTTGDRWDGEDVDVERIAASLATITGRDVRVDLKVLHLPQDDPGLDAVTRPTGYTYLQEGGAQALRMWVDAHWDEYWVPHEGCEAYVSLLILGDAGDAENWGGYAFHDRVTGHRFSFSIVPEVDVEAWAQAPDVPPEQQIQHLFVHETGHLIGLQHPHNLNVEEDGAPRWETNWAFSSAWTAMSYRGWYVDFSAVDAANWARNRAGYAVLDAAAAGHADSPEVAEALRLMGANAWDDAWQTLRPLLAGVP